MNVTLDQSLVDYMHKHHRNTISLAFVEEMTNFHNVLFTKYPLIKYKTPKHVERYDEYHVDDIRVYVSKEAETEGAKLEFHDHKRWGHHSCHVDGLKYHKYIPADH